MEGADVRLKWVLMFPIAGSRRGEEGHVEGPHYPQRAPCSLRYNWLARVHALPGCFLLGQEPKMLEYTMLLFTCAGLYSSQHRGDIFNVRLETLISSSNVLILGFRSSLLSDSDLEFVQLR